MLRRAVLFIAVLLAAVGVGLLTRGIWVPGLQMLALAVVALVGIVFERWRYRTKPPGAGVQWQRTDERFSDPISGEEMEVQYDPISGERRYVRR